MCPRRRQVLLVSSSKEPNKWVIPGGGVEPDEQTDRAALREVREEAGVEGHLGRCLGVFEVSVSKGGWLLSVRWRGRRVCVTIVLIVPSSSVDGCLPAGLHWLGESCWLGSEGLPQPAGNPVLLAVFRNLLNLGPVLWVEVAKRKLN